MKVSGLLFENEHTPAPGTDESVSDPDPTPAAEPSKTDSGGQPETIPYARFKEVNDRLKELSGFEPLVKMGYDPDSLGQLAAFEAEYFRNPIETMKTMVDNLDLPDERKAALKESFGTSDSNASVVPAEGTSKPASSGDDEPPAWAKPLIEDHQSRKAAETESSNQQMVDKMVSHWKQLDKDAGVTETVDKVILRYIASQQPRGDLTTVEALAEAARTEFLDDRDQLLGDAVKNRPNGPRSVPSGGVVPTEGLDFGGDIHKATAAARQAIEAGNLGG